MYLDGITTKRLKTRKLELSDITIWEKFFENNNSLPYLGIDLSKDNRTQSKEWIERQLWRYENNKFGHQALIERKTNNFVGQCGLLTQQIDNKIETEIAYHIIPEYWGLGFATEAAKEFRDYAFRNDLCNSLISVIDVRNIASQKVAKKNGMKVSMQTKYNDLNVYVYRINKDEWGKQTTT